jgi:hypothetical protein
VKDNNLIKEKTLADTLRHRAENGFAGSEKSEGRWRVVEGGDWNWNGNGVYVDGKGIEWVGLAFNNWHKVLCDGKRNFLIELNVSGKAQSAGLSFGPYRDFLTEIDEHDSPKRLQLEVDADARWWAFRVDGRLIERQWWNEDINSIEDILNGDFTFKARNAHEVWFRDLTFHAFESSCRLSVIVTCNRFLQRLRVSLRNWCHQSLPSGVHEILVVNPQSPDGTHEHLAAVARSYPNVRVREISVESELAKNKGSMINRALQASHGEWIWLTDADCVFSSDCAETVLAQLNGTSRFYFGQRKHLSVQQTDALLAGRMDALSDFKEIATASHSNSQDNMPWGYTQIIHRTTLERVRYRENINHFAHTDDIFVAECQQHGIATQQIEGLFCLHLDHPFSWYGVDMFL